MPWRGHRHGAGDPRSVRPQRAPAGRRARRADHGPVVDAALPRGVAVVVDVGAAQPAIIVSRELGIPCVVSVTGAAQRIPDGAVVTVDGTAGTVTIEGLRAADGDGARGFRVVELGVWVAARAPAGCWPTGAPTLIKVEAPAGDPTWAPGVLGARRPRPTRGPVCSTSTTGQAQRRARPPPRGRDECRRPWPRPTCSSPTLRPGRSTGSARRRRAARRQPRLVYASVTGYGRDS